MRVLEGKSCVSLGMVKKKHRIRKQEKNEFADSSDEGGQGGGLCHHVTKAVNLNLVKKAIKQHGVSGKCLTCENDEKEKDIPTNAEESTEVDIFAEETIWLCLQCGNQGCGRNSQYQHALKHHQTPRSICHSLVVNLTTWDVWCYDCDDDITLDCSRKLGECVEFVKKQYGAPPSQPAPGKRSSQWKRDVQSQQSEEASVQESVVETQQNKVKAIMSPQHQAIPGLPKVKGLSNLGNTCFFNAVMQNLSQTPILQVVLSEKIMKDVSVELGARHRFTSDDLDEGASGSSDDEKLKTDIEPLNITLAEGGTLSNSVLAFLKDMQSSASKHVVTPSNLFGQVCKKSPRFKGFQQQDSHELLRCLLDGMKAEEVKRSQHAILKAFNLPESTKAKSKIDEDTRVKVKAYGHQVKHTFVDSIFGGVFISTVMCEECSVPSQIFEPFLDISLPVTEEKTVRPNYGGRKKDAESKATENDELDNIFCASPANKPSKHQSKKEKRKAKKEAKRMGKSGSVSREGDNKDEQSGEESAQDDQLKGNENQHADGQSNDAVPDSWLDEGEENNEQKLETESTIEKAEETDGQGLSLEQVAAQTADTRGDSLEDTDSNKVNASVSDQNLSDSDADVEDNLEPSLNYQDETANDCSPENTTEAQNAPTKRSNSSLDKCTQDSKESNNPEHCKDNKNLIIKNDKDAQRTKSIESLESINSMNSANSCSNIHTATINKMDAQDCEEIKTILEPEKHSPQNQVNFEDQKLSDLTDKLTGLKLENDHTVKIQNGFIEDDDIIKEDINKTNILKSMHNVSRPNTPQSPKLSRSSSLKVARTRTKQLKLEARLAAMRPLVPRYQPRSQECSVMSSLNHFTSAELLTGTNKFGCHTCTSKKYANVDKDVKREAVYTSASKQVLLFTPPAVLTLHLKRFQQVGFSFRKVSRHVDFPLMLDLAPYCSALAQGIKPGQSKVMYSLYGIVEHSGRLTGGHYTAYVKVRPHSTQHIMQFLQHCDIKSIHLERLLDRLASASTRDDRAADTAAAGGGPEPGGQGEGEGGVLPPDGKWYYISDSRVTETTQEKVLRCQAYLLFYERVL